MLLFTESYMILLLVILASASFVTHRILTIINRSHYYPGQNKVLHVKYQYDETWPQNIIMTVL